MARHAPFKYLANRIKALSYHFHAPSREQALSRSGQKSTSSVRNSSKTTNQLRIIGGQWRGRKLSFPDVDGLRPTGDRIRETLFNWLAGELIDARCLDLFAGSGALGLEAASRGAANCVLIERHPLAAASLRQSVAILKAPNIKIDQTDASQYLSQAGTTPFDVVFMDPPFSLDLWASCAQQLEQGGWLSDTAWIYLEAPSDALLALPASWHLYRDKKAGNVSYRLYRRSAGESMLN